MTDPKPYYRQLLEQKTARAEALEAKYSRFALLRLVCFVLIIVLLILAFSAGIWYGLLALVIILPLATRGVRWHQHIGEMGREARVGSEIASRELRALDHDLSDLPDGAAYLDPTHPYALDLDIFGPHSLFQYVNRTVMQAGADLLAHQLSVLPAPAKTIARREAARALAQELPFLIEFSTRGHALKKKEVEDAHARLKKWVARPPALEQAALGWLLPLLPVLTVIGLWWCFTREPWQLGLLAFVPAVLLWRRHREAIDREHAYVSRMRPALETYAGLIELLEEHPTAPAALRKLAYRCGQLDVRYNPFVIFLELFGGWSLNWTRQLDRWRAEHRDDLTTWLDALAATDARVSWAFLRVNHPDWAEAELTDRPHLSGTALAHPLLPPEGRIANTIAMETDGHIHLVTGSNMAGKSTWLRTVGINLVLARAGGPVCAAALTTPPLDVWTSMRTQDNLSERTSSFYAELKRLSAIIAAVTEGSSPVFFLLDEILKGTNSRDRHTGARALIRQLIRRRGAGIIATHDLELAALADEPGSRVENFAMEVQTDGDRLTFDYKLHPGVSKSFNATALMARMGIDIDPADISLTHD